MYSEGLQRRCTTRCTTRCIAPGLQAAGSGFIGSMIRRPERMPELGPHEQIASSCGQFTPLLGLVFIDTSYRPPKYIFTLMRMAQSWLFSPRLLLFAELFAREVGHRLRDLQRATGGNAKKIRGRLRHDVVSRHEMLSKFRQNVARFRLYRHRSLQVNARFSAFF